MAGARERVALGAFIANAVLAGGNGVGIRFSNRELPPLWGATLRFSLAAVLLIAIMAAMRVTIPRGRALTGAALFGLLQFAGAFALAYYALVHLHAGFGQILLAVVPLATLLLAVVERQERFRADALIGGIIALAGVALMSRAPLRDSVPILAVLAALGSAFCFAQAAVVVRRFPPVHPVAMNAVGMVAGSLFLFGGSLIFGEQLVLPSQTATWLAIAYLVPVGSVLVFLLYLVVLKFWPASRASYVMVVIPVVTVALSAWLDDEPVTGGLVFGGLLVLAGVYVGALRRGRRARPAQSPFEEPGRPPQPAVLPTRPPDAR